MGVLAGLSSSLQDQLKQILEVVGRALRNVNHHLRNSAKQKVNKERRVQARSEYESRIREAIRQEIWHDPRLGAVAGVGIISELGLGDESLDELTITSIKSTEAEGLEKRRTTEDQLARKERTLEELHAIKALPVVVIKNYAARGRTGKQELQEVLSQWAATVVENQVLPSLRILAAANHLRIDCSRHHR